MKKEIKITIEVLGVAKTTAASADTEVFALVDNTPNENNEEFSDGHIRTQTRDGVCYCQMHCGGKWNFYYTMVNGKKVFCTCGGSPMNISSCGGNTYILTC